MQRGAPLSNTDGLLSCLDVAGLHGGVPKPERKIYRLDPESCGVAVVARVAARLRYGRPNFAPMKMGESPARWLIARLVKFIISRARVRDRRSWYPYQQTVNQKHTDDSRQRAAPLSPSRSRGGRISRKARLCGLSPSKTPIRLQSRLQSRSIGPIVDPLLATLGRLDLSIAGNARLALAWQRNKRTKPFRAVMHVRERHVSRRRCTLLQSLLEASFAFRIGKGRATATKKKRKKKKKERERERTNAIDATALYVCLPATDPPRNPLLAGSGILENTIRIFLDERRLDFSTGGNLAGASRCALRSKKM